MSSITSDQIILALATGNHDADLEKIKGVLEQRRSLQKDKVLLDLASSLKPGETVTFNNKTHPRYMIGLKAKVIKLNSTTCWVEMEDRSQAGRFGRSSKIKAPYSLLVKG